MWKKNKHKASFAFQAEKVFLAAVQPLGNVFNHFQTSPVGLDAEEVIKRQSVYGKNEVEHEKKQHPVSAFIKAFINPFIGVLTVLVIVSFVIDVLLADPGEQDWTAIVIISTMVFVSTLLRFIQEWKANLSSESLLKLVTNTCYVIRPDQPAEEISIAELVPGDIVRIAAGDMIPADLRLIEAKDLFVSQSSLTGESDPIEKCPQPKGKKYSKGSVIELENICFMGSNVVSGSAVGIVLATGNQTYLGTIARSIAGHRAATAFDKGISKVSFLLGKRTYQRRLAGGFHLCRIGSRGVDSRNVPDDCNGQPFERSADHVEKKDHRERLECHPEFRGNEYPVYRQDRYLDLRPDCAGEIHQCRR